MKCSVVVSLGRPVTGLKMCPNTVCPKSLDPFYIVAVYKNSWTYCLTLFPSEMINLLDGYSEFGAHVLSNIGNLIC